MEIKARIPGMITAVNVKEGDTVKVKSVVCVMEAMKMEQPIASPVEGVVKEVYKVKCWREAEKWDNDKGNVDNRLECVGEIAEEGIRQLFIGKTIPAKYRKPGMASPVIYSK